MLFGENYEAERDENEDTHVRDLTQASYLPEVLRVPFLKSKGYSDEDVMDLLETVDELNMADAVSDEEAIPDMLEAGLDASIDAAEDAGKDDSKYRTMSKRIMSNAIKGSDGKNEVTSKEEYDFDGDGDPDITVTTKNDGKDSSADNTPETDNASESEDKPNEEKKLNSNVVNAVSGRRF